MFYRDERLALFIDGANLYAAARALGFDIDYKLLRTEFMRRGKLLRLALHLDGGPLGFALAGDDDFLDGGLVIGERRRRQRRTGEQKSKATRDTRDKRHVHPRRTGTGANQ